MPDTLTFSKDSRHLRITATNTDGGHINSKSIEALLLFDIRYLLDEIRMGLIDVENAVEKNLDK